MKLLKTFKGRVVKRMRRVPEGLLLIYLGPVAGERGEQEIVSQADWDRYGQQQAVRTTLEALRQGQAAV